MSRHSGGKEEVKFPNNCWFCFIQCLIFTACNIDSDPLAEISHFQIRVASLAAVLLHEDILTISADQERSLVASSVRQMKHCAETFFEKLNWVSVFNLVSNEYEKSRSIFEEACKLNQLRLGNN